MGCCNAGGPSGALKKNEADPLGQSAERLTDLVGLEPVERLPERLVLAAQDHLPHPRLDLDIAFRQRALANADAQREADQT